MAIVAPKIISRSDWKADAYKGRPVGNRHYKRLSLHHAAGYDAQNVREGKRAVQRIQQLHQQDRGWSDIGYHFLIDGAGNIYQGRAYAEPKKALADGPQLAIGAHVGGHNTGNIGVCLLGCFHPPAHLACEDVLTKDRFEALTHLFAFLAQQYGIDPASIKGHGDQVNTACPGDNLRRRLPEIQLQVKDLLAEKEQAEPDHEPLIELPTELPGRWLQALTALKGKPDVVGASARTAAQDGLAPGIKASHTMAQTDWQRVQAAAHHFRAIGRIFELPAALLAAVASRESRCGNVLATDGSGDHGNAFGIMQIDFRHHDVRTAGGPAGFDHILQATEILLDFRHQVARKRPDWDDKHWLKGAVVAYNSGVGNVATITHMDVGTTGNDYGSDVIARAQYFVAKGLV